QPPTSTVHAWWLWENLCQHVFQTHFKCMVGGSDEAWFLLEVVSRVLHGSGVAQQHCPVLEDGKDGPNSQFENSVHP
ncbi:hypothetical protein, partial [Deinococcus sp. GbtcB9]|uniref:hypothetical protein n=1 Tax=Deinococcus sp. GbtcB9 TaxID=2824754 RepID=UPI001C2F9BDA